MLGRTTAAVLTGVEATLIDVEVDLGGGLPTIAAVGLPDPAVREGLDRIRAALRHGGFKLPQRRVIVSLAPAEQRKHGAALDLPIAGAMLAADGQLPPLDARRDVVVGELSLDGRVRPVRGMLAIAIIGVGWGWPKGSAVRSLCQCRSMAPHPASRPIGWLASSTASAW